MVFILDGRVPESPGIYETCSFSLLFGRYLDNLQNQEFQKVLDTALKTLEENASAVPVGSRKVAMSRQSIGTVRSSFDREINSLNQEIRTLEEDVRALNLNNEDSNATQNDQEKKNQIEKELEKLRAKQFDLEEDRKLIIRLADSCFDLESNGKWSELERGERQGILVRVMQTYSTLPKNSKMEDIKGMIRDLEYARAERVRDYLLEDMIEKETAGVKD